MKYYSGGRGHRRIFERVGAGVGGNPYTEHLRHCEELCRAGKITGLELTILTNKQFMDSTYSINGDLGKKDV